MAKTLQGNPYENLASAIIIQAADDYKAALKKIKRDPENREAVSEVLSIERFFRSGWYGALTMVDGNFLINKLREEVAE